MSESDQIHRARQGDGIAWEGLVREHQTAAFRLAYLLLGNADDAKDVAQEAFIRAFRALDRFDEDRPFRPWLLRITSNLVHNRERSAGRYLAAVRRLFETVPRSALTMPGPDLQQKEEARTLWQAMRHLQRQDREVIYLRYFLDLSVDETAQILGVARGTVKSRLHRALERLRTVVEKEYPQLGEGRRT